MTNFKDFIYIAVVMSMIGWGVWITISNINQRVSAEDWCKEQTDDISVIATKNQYWVRYTYQCKGDLNLIYNND